jgi:hypothetical protein
MRPYRLIGPLALIAVTLVPSGLGAQILPQETVSLAGGRVTLGGEFTATVAPDDEGQFNDTDYDRSALQLLRLGVTATFRPISRVTFLTELRAEGDTAGGEWTTLASAAYVRVRPWKDRAIDIQAGRIPPVFGAAGRRLYASDNVLIGYPLAWQYLTVLRTDAVPANADQLLGARTAGGRPWYSVGAPGYALGVPLTTAFRYDTGVEARFGHEHQKVSWAIGLTAGTLSSPGVHASNGGPQVSTRLALRPVIGLVVGASFADGRFLADEIDDGPAPLPVQAYGYQAAATEGRYHQQTWGADAEYSIGHFLARAELVSAGWRLPVIGTPALPDALRSTAIMTEARYRLMPGLTGGLRVDHQGFSEIQGSYQRAPWDAPVTRVEAGLAWNVTRNLIVRGSVQRNTRTRGSVTAATLPALQVTLWF